MLSKIKVYGRLAKFLGERTFEAEVKTPIDTFKFLLANFPNLERHMMEQNYCINGCSQTKHNQECRSHIINASKNKCFYFLDDHGDKIYPDHQESGDIFAWPSWLVHGVDHVQEPNLNRLIVAGNVALETYSNP